MKVISWICIFICLAVQINGQEKLKLGKVEKFVTEKLEIGILNAKKPPFGKGFLVLPPAVSTDFKKVRNNLIRLVAEERTQQQIKTEASFGLTTNQAGNDDFYRFATGIELTYAPYPLETKVKFAYEDVLQNNETQQRISDNSITSDYNLTPSIQIFTFTNLVVNKFMGIDRRTETGLGAVFEVGSRKDNRWEPNNLTKRGEALRKKLVKSVMVTSNPGFAALFNAYKQDLTKTQSFLFKRMESVADATRKEYSKFRFALLVGIFHEFERATISEKVVVQRNAMDTTLSLSLTLPSQTTWRFEIRPTIDLKWDDNDDINWSLQIRPYFKFRPNFDPLRLSKTIPYQYELVDNKYELDKDTKADWRLDGMVNMNLSVKNFTFTLQGQVYFDNVSPFALIDSGVENLGTKFVKEPNLNHLIRIVGKLKI